ncbi:hypothetical protein [Chroococcidiopsis sp. SAG 2025]|uniref:hypothetical protein n=1 Tax=Chroococcidiopsis sp. SAG 2025 TaxID=171389 RepID=UPI0029373D3F|nr:hypothetical protein [Chroococcidiopsis sp. SAG 2025]
MAIATMFISVGHRSSLVKYHQQVLELYGNSGWQLFPVQSYIQHAQTEQTSDIFNDGFSAV